MKQDIFVCLCLVFLFTVVGALVTCNTGCAPILPGQDPIAVNAERSTAAAFDTIDSFLQFDNDNREILKAKAPSVHALAEKLRAQNPDGTPAPGSAAYQLKEVRGLTKLYETTKAPGDAQNLADSLTQIETMARDARLALLAATAAKGK